MSSVQTYPHIIYMQFYQQICVGIYSITQRKMQRRDQAGGVFSSQESIRSGIPALLKQGLIKTAVQYINFVADSIQ